MDYDYTEFTIKKKSGKLRKIVNPSSKLKSWQRRYTTKVLTPQFKELATEAGVYDTFHGFVPGRNCVTGASRHLGSKYTCVLMMDLSDFFDTVKWTSAGITEDMVFHKSTLFHKDGYAAQGFPSSPMIANIALIPVIRDIQRKVETEHPGDFAITMYADDITISLEYDMWRRIRDIATEVFEEYGYKVNPTKTRVRFHKYGSIKVLGVNLTKDGIMATRKTNRKVRAVKQQVRVGKPQGQVLGGLRTWQSCKYPKGMMFTM